MRHLMAVTACMWLLTTPAWAITNNQISDVLEWQFPGVEKSFSVMGNALVFQRWGSAEPKPTLAQCEAWLPGLPDSFIDAQKEAVIVQRYDIEKLLKAMALVTMDELNLIRGSSAATIAGMSDRTEEQVRTAVINKYKAIP